MLHVTLTESEVQQGVALGLGRHEGARKGNRPEMLVSDMPAIDNDIISMCAEIAVAKLFGVPFDDRIAPPGESLPPHDLTLSGLGVDVKNTTNMQGNLIVAPWKKHDDIAYLLTRGEPPTYEVVGYMLGRNILTKRTFPSGSISWFVPADELTPVEQLLRRYKSLMRNKANGRG